MNNISKRKIVGIWLLLIPIAIYILPKSIAQIISQPFSILDFGVFMLLIVLLAAFPIQMKDKVFNLLQGISVSGLVVFGLSPELLLSFIGMLVVLIRSKVGPEQHYRYPLNILATWFSSIISAGAYYLTLEVFNTPWIAPHRIIAMAVYLLTYNLFGQLLGLVIEKHFYDTEKVSFIDEDLFFSSKVAAILLPSAYILVYLYESLGAAGVVLAGVPFIAISVVTQYYYKAKMNTQFLFEITKYSQLLARKKNKKAVIKDFMEYVIKIFPGKQVYYFKMIKDNLAVLDSVSILDGLFTGNQPEVILTENSPLMSAFRTETVTVYDQADEWRNKAYYYPSYHPESAIALPVISKGKNRGLIVITHPRRKVYDEILISLISMFYQYFLNVLETINEFEDLESSNHTDYLTNLPNLKGFYKYFNEISRAEEYETLSLIVLDLDHFKTINDKHGHIAGNDVLIQVSNVLMQFSSNEVFVARFGGEEFILLAQNLSKKEAYQLTENIRKVIERTIFKIDYSIDTGATAVIHATASFGLATYPDDVNDIHSLVQLADRAMYLGSKQTGRNKITMHEAER